MKEAQDLLQSLGALDPARRITAHGKALARLPLHPRLGHMLATRVRNRRNWPRSLNERDPMGRSTGSDLLLRVRALRDGRVPKDYASRVKQEITRLKKLAPSTQGDPLSLGAMAALAYPDRIGQRRKGDVPRYILSGGKGAVMEPSDVLGNAPYIVVTDTDGNPREARIRQAVQIELSEMRALYDESDRLD